MAVRIGGLGGNTGKSIIIVNGIPVSLDTYNSLIHDPSVLVYPVEGSIGFFNTATLDQIRQNPHLGDYITKLGLSFPAPAVTVPTEEIEVPQGE